MAVGGAGIRLQGRSPRPAVASIASFPRLGRRVGQFGALRGRRALRVPSLASSTSSAPPGRPRSATSKPLTSQSLLPGPQVPTGKWPPLPPGDSKLWQEATTHSDLFLPAAWSQRSAHLRGYPLAALANTTIPCRQPLPSSSHPRPAWV